MLDMFGILLSTITTLIVIFRAVRLDRNQPWFQKTKPMVGAETASRPWRRAR
jgi:hypothetical protein